jgi:hypothetical protein
MTEDCKSKGLCVKKVKFDVENGIIKQPHAPTNSQKH